MPELPEVETVCRGLRPFLVDRVITDITVRRMDLRKPIPKTLAAQLTGRRVSRVDRRGKYLLLTIVSEKANETELVTIVHLGMSGRLAIGSKADETYEKHDHLILTTDREVTIRFNDPRRFGLIDLVEQSQLERCPLLCFLGPEPLLDDFTPFVLAKAFSSRRGSVKNLLLDQRIVAGIGNIYASEALFAAGIHPMRAAQSMSLAECGALVDALRAVLLRAIAAGGSSLRNHVQPSGELGYFQHQWAVYGQEGGTCPGCQCGGGGIERLVQANRSSFYCPYRQN